MGDTAIRITYRLCHTGIRAFLTTLTLYGNDGGPHLNGVPFTDQELLHDALERRR